MTGNKNGDNNIESKEYLVVLKETVFIEKDAAESIVIGKVLINGDKDLSNQCSFLFCPSNVPVHENIALAHELVNSTQRNFLPIRLLNMSNDNLTLNKNTVLGFVEPILENAHHRSFVLGEEKNTMETKDLIDYHTNEKYNRSEEENTLITKLLNDYNGIFSKSKMDIGKTDVVKHQIVTLTKNPIAQPLRKVPLAMESKIETLIENLKSNNIIRESSSPWSSPIVAVQKPDGQIRMCIDYRKLNSVTERPIFPIPDEGQLFDTLGESKFFSTVDFSQGYYQVGMDEKDIEKTAFTTKQGHFEFLRMPFGLSGAPATFQRMMHCILKGLNWKTCLIYLDDVLIFSKTLTEHNTRLREVFECIKNAGLKLSPLKCNFLLKEVSYLGHTISADGVKTDKSKIIKIINFQPPKYEADLVSFLGFCGYYRKFIKNYSKLVEPLESICKKKTKHSSITWTKEALHSFEALKDSLTTAPVLSFPTKDGEFVLDTDASDTCCGAVLSQIQNGSEKVIAYASHKFTNAERKYCTTRKELLAVHRYFMQFKHYLWGRTFIVRTDHKSLIWFLNWRNPNTSQYCQWRTDLEPFDMNVQHRLGKKHTNADFLSRLDCEQCEVIHANPKRKSKVKVYENQSENKALRKITLQQKFNFDQTKDKTLQMIITLMKQKKLEIPYPNELNDLSEDASIFWYFRKQLRIRGNALFYLTNDGKYLFIPPKLKRNEIVIDMHKELCHIGFEKLFDKLRQVYFWPKMRFDIKKVTNSCKNCAFTKLNDCGVTPLQPSIVSFPFQRIGIDIAGPLPTSKNGFKYILGVIDYFSKYPMLVPLKSTDSVSIAKALFDRWISVFGCPYQIHSDGGPNISSNCIKEICNRLGIIKTTSTPYHPKSNGLIERLFRTAKEALRAVLYNCSKQNWPEKIPAIELALRSVKQSTTNYSPFEILFGKEMRDADFISHHLDKPNRKFSNENEYVLNFEKNLQMTHKIVKENIKNNAEKMKKKQKFLKKELEVGSFVMIELPPGNTSPLGQRFDGPFKVVKILRDYVYQLQSASGKIVERHRDHLKPVLVQNPDVENLITSQLSSSAAPQSSNNINSQQSIRMSKRIKQPVQRYGFHS